MPTRLFAIGEVADLTGMPIKTIRYYAEIGLAPPTKTTEARYRLYSPEDIWRLELIRTLRYVGFGLDEIARILTGKLDVATAIGWQIEALDGQIERMTRQRDLLRQAQLAQLAQAARADRDALARRPDDDAADVPDGDTDSVDGGADTLAYLHALGAAVTRDAEARGRFLAEKLGAIVGGDNAPGSWMAQLQREAAQRLPAKPTPEQAAAWAELTALLTAPETQATISPRLAPFWELMRRRQVDMAWWSAAQAELGARAQAALTAGEPPTGAVAQTIARDWAAVYAQAMGQPCDDAFLRRLAEMAPQFVDERSRRIQELLERAGWNANAPSQLAAQQLILDALAGLTPDPFPQSVGRGESGAGDAGRSARNVPHDSLPTGVGRDSQPPQACRQG